MPARLFEIIQFFDNDGNPLSGGQIYTFEAGTSTPKAAYTNSGAAAAHSNPIVLDASGRVSGGIWLLGGAYKLRLDDADDVTLLTLDNVPATSISGNSITSRATATTTLSATSGQTTLTAASLVPANSRLIGVFVKVTTALGTSNGLTGFDVGYAPFLDAYGSGIATTLNANNTVGDHPHEQPTFSGALDILITADAAFDGTGQIQVTAEYEQGTAP